MSEERWPWWDTRVSAQTAQWLGWGAILLAATGAALMALNFGEWLSFGLALAQFTAGCSIAAMHFKTARRRGSA